MVRRAAVAMAATFGDLVTGSGPFGLSVQNNATTANAIGVSGAMRSTTASSTSTGVRGVNFGAGIGVAWRTAGQQGQPMTAFQKRGAKGAADKTPRTRDYYLHRPGS